MSCVSSIFWNSWGNTHNLFLFTFGIFKMALVNGNLTLTIFYFLMLCWILVLLFLFSYLSILLAFSKWFCYSAVPASILMLQTATP